MCEKALILFVKLNYSFSFLSLNILRSETINNIRVKRFINNICRAKSKSLLLKLIIRFTGNHNDWYIIIVRLHKRKNIESTFPRHIKIQKMRLNRVLEENYQESRTFYGVVRLTTWTILWIISCGLHAFNAKNISSV